MSRSGKLFTPPTRRGRQFQSVAWVAVFTGGACQSILGIEDLHSGPRPGDPTRAELQGGAGSPFSVVMLEPAAESGGLGGRPEANGGVSGVESQSPDLGDAGEPSLALPEDLEPGVEAEVDAGAELGEPMNTILAVQGTVMDFFQRPVPNATVTIGEVTVVTDAQGSFRVGDVQPPYDAAIALTVNLTGGLGFYDYVYQGLTRADPTLQVYRALPARSSSVEVEFGDDLFQQPNEVAVLGFAGPDGRFSNRGLSNDVQLLSAGSWTGPASTSGNIHALRVVRSEGGSAAPPLSYSSYETHPLALLDSVASNVSFELPEQAIQVGLVTGSVTEAGLSQRANWASLRFPDGARLPLLEDNSPQPAFSYLVPNLPGASVEIAAGESGFIAPFAVAHTDGVVGGQVDPVVLTVPRPVVLGAPGQGAVVSAEQPFSWSGAAQTAGVFVWHLEFRDFFQGMFIVTSSNEIRIPSVPGGVIIAPGTPCEWSVETHGDFVSVDEAAGPEGLLDSYSADQEQGAGPKVGPGYFTESVRRGFTMGD